jgi:DNA-binding LytR/AlgR family response regulator
MMETKLNRILYRIKSYLGLYLSIVFGIFLFVLFFQPFPLDQIDFNNRLIFISGLAAIAFLMMILGQITLLLSCRNSDRMTQSLLPVFLLGFGLFALSSTAFAFYLRYVGHVGITFYIMLRIILICITIPVILRIYDVINNLKILNASLVNDSHALQKQLERYHENYLSIAIEFVSENTTETVKLMIADVAFIKSADNYVEIIYREADAFKKKMIRNTMKNMEQLLKPYSSFVRCHRICILNTHYIDKFVKDHDNHWVTIKGYEEKIPVSRQYLLKVKEML